MSKQKRIFEYKGFKRVLIHQKEEVDISNQPQKEPKLLNCAYCSENFKIIKDFLCKWKHAKEYIVKTEGSSAAKF